MGWVAPLNGLVAKFVGRGPYTHPKFRRQVAVACRVMAARGVAQAAHAGAELGGQEVADPVSARPLAAIKANLPPRWG
jgi:hypothetical protein